MPRAAPTTLFLWTSSDILAKRSQNPLKIHHSWAKFQPQTTIFGPWAQRTSGADTLESRHFFGSPTTADEGDMVFFLKSKGWIPNTPRWKPDASTCVSYSKLIPHVQKYPQKILFSKTNGSWPLPSVPDTLESALRHSQRTRWSSPVRCYSTPSKRSSAALLSAALRWGCPCPAVSYRKPCAPSAPRCSQWATNQGYKLAIDPFQVVACVVLNS